MRSRALARWITLACVLIAAGPAQAREVLLSFHSDIQVNRDATLTVTEYIRYVSERKQIKRGIYRDFKMRVQVLDVLRNGQPPGHHTKWIGKSYRLYVGQEDHLLRPGEHGTSIRYKTPYQLSFFEDHDELYWQVTGTEWAFPIFEIGATVTLPEPVPADRIGAEAYTGAPSSSGSGGGGSVGGGGGGGGGGGW